MADRLTGPEQSSPASIVLFMYMQYWTASAILAAVELALPDAVDDTPRPAVEIASAVGANQDCVLRLLRGLAGAGIFRQQQSECFVSTPMSRALRSDAPGKVATIIRLFGLPSMREAMVHYETAIRTGESAFAHAHGGATPFDVLRQRPAEAAVYHEAMTLDTALVAAVLERYDFSDVQTLVDVGGGRGAFLARILLRNPRQRGVLFDLPEVVDRTIVDELGVADRCAIQAGDMHVTLPTGADGYLLKNILHGWPDAECVTLLQRMRASGAHGARVFIVENLIPDGGGPAPSKIFDLFLLLGGTRSRVRSLNEMRALLDKGGFACSRVLPIVFNQCLIEATMS